MKKNIDISEDCKAKLMVVAAKQGLLLKPFLESQLNAMAETGQTFTEVFRELTDLKSGVKQKIN